MSDLISRQAAIDAIDRLDIPEDMCVFEILSHIELEIGTLPSAQPERKKMSNKEWVDFLSEQFTVSRTSAREMLHGLMRWKAEDNFKNQFSGRKETR